MGDIRCLCAIHNPDQARGGHPPTANEDVVLCYACLTNPTCVNATAAVEDLADADV